MPLLQRRSEQPGFSPKTGRIPIWPRHPDLRAVRVKQEGVLIRRQVQFPHWSGRTREQTPTQHLNSRFTSFTFATSSISFCLFMFWQNCFLQEIKSNLVEDFIRSPNLYLNLGKSKTHADLQVVEPDTFWSRGKHRAEHLRWSLTNRSWLLNEAATVYSWTTRGANTLCNRLHVTLALWRNRGDMSRVSLRFNRRGCFCQHDPGHPKGWNVAGGIGGLSPQLRLKRTQTFFSLRHDSSSSGGDDDDDDDGRYQDGVWGQAGEKHICRVAVGRRGRLFECCHYVKASPGCSCTLTPVAESWRPPPSGRSVCLLLLKGSVSRIQARVRGLATCPKSKL